MFFPCLSKNGLKPLAACAALRYEASKRLDTFNVSASCAAGYRGVAAVEETKRGDPEGGPKSSS